MAGLNRIIFLVLGLVAVVIFFAVLTGRINLKGRLPTFSDGTKKETVTPTPTSEPPSVSNTGAKKTATPSQNQPYKTVNKTTALTTIPATGAPTVLLPITFSLLTAGLYLTRKK